MAEIKGFKQWALVEIMGHQRIAGFCSEEEMFGAKFLRVDVPQIGDDQPLTKYLGGSAIYAITPVSEETARLMAQQIDPEPVNVWSARKLLEKADAQAKLPPPASSEEEYDEEDDDL